MNFKQFWDHSTKPSMFVQVENGVEIYRGPFKEVKVRDVHKELEELRRERDEAIADRDIARLAAMDSDRAHDRMVGELEKVYQERDEAREKLAKITKAAEAVIDRWEQPAWKDTEPTAAVIYRLRDALGREAE